MAIVLAGKKSGITNSSLASTKTFDLTETHCNAESQSVITREMVHVMLNERNVVFVINHQVFTLT